MNQSTQPNSSTKKKTLKETLQDGFRVIPLEWRLTAVGSNKQPIHKDWQTAKSTSDQICADIESGRAKGFGLVLGEASSHHDGSFLLAVDFDGPGTFELATEMNGGEPLPESVAWTSGKADRHQRLYRVPMDYWQELAGKREFATADGHKFELRYNGHQSVLPPSVHPETGAYAWITPPKVQGDAWDDWTITKIAWAPQWMIDALLIDQREPAQIISRGGAAATGDRDWAIEYMEAIVSGYPADDREEWVRIGHALKSVGGDDFYQLWDTWSSKSANYEANSRKRWDGFKPRHNGIAVLGWFAKKAGWRPPAGSPGNDSSADTPAPETAEELKDSEEEVKGLLWNGSQSPPQIIADRLHVPLRNLGGSLGLSVEPFILCLLAILASRLRAGTRLLIDPVTGYYAPSILWVGLVGDSGSLKTPILKALTSPLDELQLEAFQNYQAQHEQYEEQLQEWEQVKKEDRGSKPKPPALKDLYFSDFTIEAIADSIRYYSELGYLVHIDELAGFFKSMDAYRNGKGSDRQRWLTSHSGSALKVNRKSSEPIYLHQTSISIVGGIQPSVLEKQVSQDPTSEDGLWARFIWSRLPMTVPPGISSGPKSDLAQILKGTYNSINQIEAETYELSAGAKTCWNEWNKRIGDLIKQEPSGILRAAYPKLKEVAARIALVIHITNGQLDGVPIQRSVSVETLSKAIQFTSWLMGQTRMLYCEIGSSDSPQSSRIIKFVNRFKGCGFIKARTVRDWWSGKDKPKTEKCREWMASLVRLGYATSNGLPFTDSNYSIEICSPSSPSSAESVTQQELQRWTTVSPSVVHVVHDEPEDGLDGLPMDYAVVHPSNPLEQKVSADDGLNGLQTLSDEIEKGITVKKKRVSGWRGVVKSEPDAGYVDVLWSNTKRAVREAVEILEVFQ